MDISDNCRMCRERTETVAHIVSECQQLAQNEYKKYRHDKVAASLLWNMCKTYGFSCTEKMYGHVVQKEMQVLENERIKSLLVSQYNRKQKLTITDQILYWLKKARKNVTVACPFDTRIGKKETEKMDQYTDLRYEILKCWKGEVNSVTVVPIVVGALGMATNKLRH